MADESLLTPALHALVGRRAQPTEAEITSRLVARTIETYGGQRRDRVPGALAPAAILVALESEAPDVRFPKVLPESAQISHELSVERPLRIGERLSLAARVANLSERFGGRFGHHLQVRYEVEYADSSGAVVARSAWTDAFFAHHQGSRDALPGGPEEGDFPHPAAPWHGSPAFASLREGDDLPALRLRPTIADGLRCCAITWHFSPYFYDPTHRNHALGRQDQHVVIPGPLRLLYLYRAAEEWVGEAGFVRAVRVAYRRPLVAGTSIEVLGRVTRVYEEDRARRADVEQVILSSAGQEHDRGFATVELTS